MREFKSRACVVVEPAHQTVVQRERHTNFGEDVTHRIEVRTARFAQELSDARQFLNDRLIFRNFAVKYAQRIGHSTPLTIAAHTPDDWFYALRRASLKAA